MESFSLIPLSLVTVFASFSSTDVDEPVINVHMNPEIVGLWELDFDVAPNFDLREELLKEFNDSDDDIMEQSNDSEPSLDEGSSIEAEGSSLKAEGSSNENDWTHQEPLNNSDDYRELVLAIQESETQNNELIKIVTEDSLSIENVNQPNTDLDNDTYVETVSTTKTSTSSIKDANQIYNDISHPSNDATTADFQNSGIDTDYIAGCKERYNFQSDNLISTTSGDEWTYGQYVYEHQDEGLPVIAITTTYDNNEVDCSGNQIDQTGKSMFAYVDYQPEANVMRWCIDNQGEKCFMTLRKLLP